MRQHLVALLLVATLALAGCAGSGGGAKQTTSAAPAPPPAPTEETGTVSGVVTNEEAQPVANVRVALLETGNETKSDASGAFVFNGIVPGTYRLLTEALGYRETGRSVTVVAGEVSEVLVSLIAITIELEPFIEMTPYTGMIQCSVNPNYAIYPCHGITGQDKAAFDFFHNQNITLAEMVAEFTWTPSNAVMGQELEVDLCKYTAERMEELCTGALGADGEDNYKYETGGPPLVLRADKLDVKKNNHWIVGAGGPLASPYPVYQQAFTVYVSLCYIEVCADDYSAFPK